MTHVTTECGHQFHTGYTAEEMRGATMDCKGCSSLLIFPVDIAGTAVRALDFHKYLHSQDARWPEDGRGTGHIEFGTSQEDR